MGSEINERSGQAPLPTYANAGIEGSIQASNGVVTGNLAFITGGLYLWQCITIERVDMLSMGSKKNILVVDDEPVWLKTLTAIMRRHGYEVKEAMSGADALQTLKVFEPDLIFLDVRMPDMNGFDLLDHIKKLPKMSTKPVVVISGMDDFHARKVARELGAVDYIIKPIDEKEVTTVIHKHLSDQSLTP